LGRLLGTMRDLQRLGWSDQSFQLFGHDRPPDLLGRKNRLLIEGTYGWESLRS
jgi:hypothetical protein